jgi:Protein of unknown function (DUF3617)
MWAYTSTITVKGGNRPQVRTVQRCTNPTEDIKKKWGMRVEQTCQFAPVRHNGDKYIYSSSCAKNGMTLQTTGVITVDSDSSYRVDTETRTNNLAQKEAIVAKRLGDCSK